MRLDAKELYGCNSCGAFAKPLLGGARTYAPAAEPAAEPRMRSMRTPATDELLGTHPR